MDLLKVNEMRATIMVLVFAALQMAGLSAVADELIMKDGSRLVGEVIKKDSGSTIEFKTSYAGVIKVKWAEVSELITDKPMTLLLKSGDTRQIMSAKNIEGSIVTSAESGAVEEIPLGEVAFVNPEPWRLGEVWSWKGNVNVDLNYERGNSDKDEYEGDLAMTFRRIGNRVKINADYDRETSNDLLTDDDWRLNGRYDHFVDKKLYYGGMLAFEHDRFADLRLRSTGGPLVGYEFYESKPMNLDVAVGPMWVNEDFYAADNDEYAAVGWNFDFDRFLIPDRIQFYHRHNGLVEVDDTSNFVWDAWTGFRFPIYAGIVATTEIKIEYDGGAQDDVDETDITYKVKLGYQW